MAPYELGQLAAQRANVPDHLKQAYAEGFAGALEKRAVAKWRTAKGLVALLGPNNNNLSRLSRLSDAKRRLNPTSAYSNKPLHAGLDRALNQLKWRPLHELSQDIPPHTPDTSGHILKSLALFRRVPLAFRGHTHLSPYATSTQFGNIPYAALSPYEALAQAGRHFHMGDVRLLSAFTQPRTQRYAANRMLQSEGKTRSLASVWLHSLLSKLRPAVYLQSHALETKLRPEKNRLVDTWLTRVSPEHWDTRKPTQYEGVPLSSKVLGILQSLNLR